MAKIGILIGSVIVLHAAYSMIESMKINLKINLNIS